MLPLLAVLAATPANVSAVGIQCDAGSSCLAGFPSPVTAGDTLLAAIYAANATVTSVSDSSGNSWSLARRQARSTLNSTTELWFAPAIAGGSDVVTAHLSGDTSPGVPELHLYEFSGLAAAPLDCAASQDTTSSDTADSSACTTTATTALLFAMANAHPNVLDGGPGFTLRADTATNSDFDEYRVVTSAGSWNATFAMDATGDVATVMGAFKGTGAMDPLKGWPVGCTAAPGAWLLAFLLSGCRAARATGRSGSGRPSRRGTLPRRSPGDAPTPRTGSAARRPGSTPPARP